MKESSAIPTWTHFSADGDFINLPKYNHFCPVLKKEPNIFIDLTEKENLREFQSNIEPCQDFVKEDLDEPEVLEEQSLKLPLLKPKDHGEIVRFLIENEAVKVVPSRNKGNKSFCVDNTQNMLRLKNGKYMKYYDGLNSGT